MNKKEKEQYKLYNKISDEFNALPFETRQLIVRHSRNFRWLQQWQEKQKVKKHHEKRIREMNQFQDILFDTIQREENGN